MIPIKTNYILKLVLIVITLIAPVYAAKQTPPSGVARLSFVSGVASFLPGSETKWVTAGINRPLITGDRLWSGANSFLELQLDSATIRMGNQTNIKILNLNSQMTQLQLTGGALILRVWRLKPKQIVEVSTPNLAFSIATPGYYRIFVNSKANITVVSVIKGIGKVYGSTTAYKINEGKSCPFGKNLKIYQCTSIPAPDSFARWSEGRDHLSKKSAIRYVHTSMIGDEDLEQYGTWRVTKKYGHVWIPGNVKADWAPYRTGHWVWIRQWGWTWIDEQPWGFAPFHYGRWVHLEDRWSWVPGPRDMQPVYAPALVVFVGGRNFNLRLETGAPGIAWFPLAPGEIYIPPGTVSREYFMEVNRSNTQINTTYITNMYNNKETNVTYQNIYVVNGVSAVSTETFKESKPVNQALVQVPSEIIVQAPKNPVAFVVPDNVSILGNTEAAQSQPPAELLEQSGVVTTQPPAPPIPFSEEQKLLEKDPGTPLTPQETEQLKPAKTDEETQLNLVNPEQNALPINKELMEQSPTIPDSTLIEKQTSPEVQPLPEVQQKPEVQPLPEEQQRPEVQPLPEEQQKPEVQPLPEVQQKPEVQPLPEVQQRPEVQPLPEEQQRPEVQPLPEEQQKPEVQPLPEVQQRPEVQPLPEEQQRPEVQPLPEEQQKPEVQRGG